MTATPCPKCGQPHPGCTAHRRDGNPCGNRARIGGRVCRMHGGSIGHVKNAAARRVAEQTAQTALQAGLAAAYGTNIPDIDPAEAMLQAVSWKYVEVRALRAQVATLDDQDRVWGTTREKTGGDDEGTTQEAKPNIWWVMLREAERDLVKFAAAARAAGCDERRVKLAEQEGALVADVLRRVLDRLQLTPEQVELVPVIVPEELRALTAGGV